MVFILGFGWNQPKPRIIIDVRAKIWLSKSYMGALSNNYNKYYEAGIYLRLLGVPRLAGSQRHRVDKCDEARDDLQILRLRKPDQVWTFKRTEMLAV
jgi:hypothetical protein